LARERAKELGISNIRLIVGDADSFHCEERNFDLVFSHALFEHLSGPEKTLTHVREYLRPGGLIALRSPDWGGFVLYPETSAVCRALDSYQAIQTDSGGDVHCGRKLGMYLRSAGFKSVKLSASYEIYPDSQWIANYLAERLDLARKNSEQRLFAHGSTYPMLCSPRLGLRLLARNRRKLSDGRLKIVLVLVVVLVLDALGFSSEKRGSCNYFLPLS
jgi:SAM-dependent methyltransferase